MGHHQKSLRFCQFSGRQILIAIFIGTTSIGCNKVGFNLTPNSVQQIEALCGKGVSPDPNGPIFTSPPMDQVVGRSITVNGTCIGPTDVVIAGGGLASEVATACVDGTFSQTLTLSDGDGLKALRVRQQEVPAENSRCVLMDTTPPRVVITTPIRNYLNTSIISVVGDCESGIPVELTQVGAPSVTVMCENNIFTSRFPATTGDGSKIIVATQTDTVGNVGRDDQQYFIDTVAPRVTIESPDANAIVKNSFMVSGICENGLPVALLGTAVQTPVTTECKDGRYTSSVVVSNRDGTFYVTAEQIDAAGNRGWDQRNVIRDTTPPAIAIRSPVAGTVASVGLPLTGACTNGIPVEISGPGIAQPITVACGAGSFNAVITFSQGDGSKQVIAAQTDAAGNRGQDTRSFVRDSTPPNIKIATPTANFTTRSTLTITGSCESGLDVQISGDIGASTTPCNSGSFQSTLTLRGGDGPKNIVVSQTDAVGNVGNDNRVFNLDTTPPSILISNPADGALVPAETIISGVCSDGFSIQISGDLNSPQTTSCGNGAFSFLASFTSGDGAKRVRVSQMDTAGNTGEDTRTYFRDTTPPAIRITSPVAGTRARQGLTVAGTCDSALPVDLSGDIAATVRTNCLNGTFSTEVAFTDGDGTKTVTAAQTDAAGNRGFDSRDFMRLNTGPAIQITAPDPGTATRSQIQISGLCTGTFPIELAGGLERPVSASCTNGKFLATISLAAPDGDKLITASQSDDIGNVGSDSRSFRLRTMAPEIKIVTPAANTVSRGTVSVVGTCAAGLLVVIEGDVTAAQTSNCIAGQFSANIILNGPDGIKTVRASQTDDIGNSGSDSRTFILDSTPPLVRFSTPNMGTVAQNGVTVTGTCESGIKVDLAGSGLANPNSADCINGQFSASVSFSSGDGDKIVTAAQTDPAGNTGSDSRSFVKDATAPLVTIETPSANTVTRGELTIGGRCENGLPVDLTGDIAPNMSACLNGLWSATVTLLSPDGGKNIMARQTDVSGNVGFANRQFILKTSAPTILITGPSANFLTRSGLTLSGTCESGIEVRISGASLGTTPCNSGTFLFQATLSAPDGAKVITATQTDNVGNSGSDSRTFILDSTPPLVQFSTPNSGAVGGAGILVTGTCEAGLPVQLSGSGIGSPGPVSCGNGQFNAQISFSPGDGNKEIVATQTDLAGNSGRDTRIFVRDTTPPAIKISTPLAGAITNSGLTLVGTCESGIPVVVGGAGLAQNQTVNCAGNTFSAAITLKGPDGEKNISVTQTDVIGNVGADSRSFLLDSTPPRVIIQSPSSGTNLTGAFTITGLCEAGLALSVMGDIQSAYAGVCPQTGQFAVPLIVSSGNGIKRVTANQTDTAGNHGSDSANYLVTPKPTATESFLADQGEGKVDILFVDDNSASMDPEQAALGQKFPSFVQELQGLDWHVGITTTDCSTGKWGICGSLLNMTGTSSYVLSPSVTGFDQVFNNTIQRPETLNCAARGECPSGLEEALKASIFAIDKRNGVNAGFFRNEAALAIVILTDEDEQSNGPASATKPQAVVDKVVSSFGVAKKFKSYAITVLAGDSVCLKQQQDQQGGIGAYGTYAMNLASLTGGKSVSICAPDYSVTLKQIGQDLRKLTQAVKLSRIPIPSSVQVTFSPAQNINWTVTDDTVLFDKPVAAGTQISVTYEY